MSVMVRFLNVTLSREIRFLDGAPFLMFIFKLYRYADIMYQLKIEQYLMRRNQDKGKVEHTFPGHYFDGTYPQNKRPYCEYSAKSHNTGLSRILSHSFHRLWLGVKSLLLYFPFHHILLSLTSLECIKRCSERFSHFLQTFYLKLLL